ncbi:MAG: hypothetical protein A2073_05805 [Deltaproteobacteria bacterium GWC2_42_11]|nr:MAG: hypothetical protein A2073_05805 [Deltaproteobacteria bacterium GWC2_42_11]HBO84785.1 hypothetical protein [Deltaproteobacteria bacterium]
MKKVFTILLAVMVSVVFVGVTVAAEKKAAEPAKKEEKKAPEKVSQATGEISAVDAKANTFTVKTDKGDITCGVSADTKITSGKDAKTLADVKVGDKVACKYAMMDGKHMCKSLEIKAMEMKKEMKK